MIRRAAVLLLLLVTIVVPLLARVSASENAWLPGIEDRSDDDAIAALLSFDAAPSSISLAFGQLPRLPRPVETHAVSLVVHGVVAHSGTRAPPAA